jgi:hypothetical protein
MPGFWRKCRIAFRCVRFGVWFLTLAVLAALLWCNLIGLPNFVKSRMVATLAERGVKLECSRMRLSFLHGLVAENVRAGQTGTAGAATFSAREVRLKLNYSALLHGRGQLDGLGLRQAQFTLPLALGDALTLTNLEAALRFGANDTWSLDHFRADFSGAQISIGGELAHAPEARNWKVFSGRGADKGATEDALKLFSSALRRIKFNGSPPLLLLTVTGDARDARSVTVRLNAAAPDVRTPWFDAEDLKLAAKLFTPTNSPLVGDAELRIEGLLDCAALKMNGAPVGAVRTHFSYEDLMLTVPDFTVTSGRTQLTLSGQESEATKNFRCRVAGALDAESLRAFLPNERARRGFGLLAFREPVTLTVDAAGNLRRPESVTATGRIALTNAAIRGQTVDWLTAGLSCSNLTVDFLRPQISRAGGTQVLTADKVTLDIVGERLFIAGGAGRFEPMVVGRAIGPQTAAAMAPYQFLGLPAVRVEGCVPLKQVNGEIVTDDADLRVDVTNAVPFRWLRFQTPAITGTVHWWKNLIIVTNATGDCYGGSAQGWGVFNVDPKIRGTDFNFFITGTNVDFHRMATGLWAPTNHLEGALSGTVIMTSANSDDWRTWNGFGALKLQNGLLWDVPVVALMSPALNAVSPGLGNSRATEATARFALTNGVIFSDSLAINSTMMRLQYAGTVDLRENLDAKVTAQLLRDTPWVGSVFSAMLWPVSKAFECRVTGQLDDPRVTPLYVPKVLLAPLHPLRSLEEWFAPANATNAPAK